MNNDQQITEKTNAALDESVENISPTVQSSLDQARSVAVEKIEHRQPSVLNIRSLFDLRILSAAVACSFFAFLILPLISIQNTEQNVTDLLSSNSGLSELILLNTFDETELDVIEDIEFAYWLSQELDQDNGLHNG